MREDSNYPIRSSTFLTEMNSLFFFFHFYQKNRAQISPKRTGKKPTGV